EGKDRRGDVVNAQGSHQEGEDGKVDDVARDADQAELEELHPVAGLQGAAADPLRGLNRGHPRLFEPVTPKCSRITGARSRSVHCGFSAGRFGPHSTKRTGPSESPRPSAPWLPPPTWLMPPQSTHSYPSAAEIKTSPAWGDVSADHSRDRPSGYSSDSKRPRVTSPASASGSPLT